MVGEALFSLFFAFDECEVKGKGRGFLVLEGFGGKNNDYPARNPIKVERDTRKTSAESSFGLIRATNGSFRIKCSDSVATHVEGRRAEDTSRTVEALHATGT